MEILRVTIAAGERKSFHKSGRYFEVMKASAPFDVHFTDRQIGVYPCIGLEAGVYSELPFQSLDIVSSSAQTITLMISDFRAGYRAQDGDNWKYSKTTTYALYRDASPGNYTYAAFMAQAGQRVRLGIGTINSNSGFMRLFRGRVQGTIFGGANKWDLTPFGKTGQLTAADRPLAVTNYSVSGNPPDPVECPNVESWPGIINIFEASASTVSPMLGDFILEPLETVFFVSYNANQNLRGWITAQVQQA
jgi:hypothetical protein